MNSPTHDHTLGTLTECKKILVYLADSDSVIQSIDCMPDGCSTQFWDGMASAKAGLMEAIEALQNYEKMLEGVRKDASRRGK